jgi:hypothetical protein
VAAFVAEQLADLVGGEGANPVAKSGHREMVIVAEREFAAFRGGHRTS